MSDPPTFPAPATGSRRLLVIVNAGGSRADAELDGALERLRAAGCEVRLERPEDPSAISTCVRSLGPRFDGVVLGGGDGTLSRSVPALLDVGRPLGILPLGTANDLARTLGIPQDPAEACEVIGRGYVRRIDVGRVDGTPFLNAAALGVSTRLTRRLDGESKRRWGVLSYPLNAIRSVRDRRPFVVDVACDGVEHRLRSIQVHVANGRHFGGGISVGEDARIDDGKLVLASVRPAPLWRLLVELPALIAGRRRRESPTDRLEGSVFVLATHRPQEISTDGELTGCSTPARFDQLRGALAVYAPGPE